MAIRQEEQLSAEALQAHLLSSLDYSSVEWSGVDRDPPDLEFRVTPRFGRSERWAVEVTGLFQYADWKGAEATRLAFEPKLQNIINNFDQNHKKSMKYSYGLWVEGPIPIKVLNDLPNRILRYVESGQMTEVALDHDEAVATVCAQLGASPTDPLVEVVLRQVAPQYERVRIMAQPGAPGIHLATTIPAVAKIPNSTKMIGDIQESVNYGIDRILDAKLPKLSEIAGFDRRVLLIWNGFVLAEAAEVAEALQRRDLMKTDVDYVYFIAYGWRETAMVAKVSRG
jgi:hypothetical protein